MEQNQRNDAELISVYLKSAKPKSIALKYKDIIGMKRAERGELVRGMDVVYIYHDTIDEAGHSENSVFEACGDAIDEIKNMARIITGEFSGTHILITSDHGFLYTINPLREDDKVDKNPPATKMWKLPAVTPSYEKVLPQSICSP